MGHRHSFVDERLMAGGFATGDVVRKTGLHDLLLSPYVGRVLYSNPETGKVAVQWPWGAEQESPVELVKSPDLSYAAPVVDQSYSSWESVRHTHDEASVKADEKFRRAIAADFKVDPRALYGRPRMATRVVDAYERKTLPLWRLACKAMHQGKNEFEAFAVINASVGHEFGDDAVRLTVANLYGLGRRIALYWKDTNRRYKVTQKEKASGRVSCPRCKNFLKPRTYRQGQRLLSCRICGFSIHPEDLC